MFKLICFSIILAIVVCCNVYRYGKTETSPNDNAILQAPSMIALSFFFKPFVDQMSVILVHNVDQIGSATPLVFLASIIFALAEYLLVALYAFKVVDYFCIQPFFRVIRITLIFTALIVALLAVWLSGLLPVPGTFLNMVCDSRQSDFDLKITKT